MAFNSIQYGIFLVVVFFGFWALARPALNRVRLWLLLAASYFFYGNWNYKYLALIVGVTLVNYAAGVAIDALDRRGAERGRGLVLFAAVASSLAVLAVFKYYNFFIANVDELSLALGRSWQARPLKLLLPVGISFYTFQGLSYTVDVYRKRFPAAHSFRAFALYIAFFPQLVAGPIVRAGDLIPELIKPPSYDHDQVMRGLYQVLSGLFKKVVIADLLAFTFVDKAFADPSAAGLPLSWLAMYGYALQIYCDFSGYSDVAIGSARMLGMEIPANFDRPYLAHNLREFWRRWHISLSTWLRDYLYISLGGNRKGRGRMYLALFLTMLLGGLWHGAAWTFVIWGAYHGALLLFTRLWQERKGPAALDKEKFPARFFKRFVTFHLVCLGWIIFRSQDMGSALVMMRNLVAAPLALSGLPLNGMAALAIGYFLHWSPVRWRERLGSRFVSLPVAVQGAALALMIALLSLMKTVSAPFIYFQF